MPSRLIELRDGRTVHVEFVGVEREWIAFQRRPRRPRPAGTPLESWAGTALEAALLALGLEQPPPELAAACEELEATVRDAPRFPCPCCGYRTLDATAMFEICPVCNWEDDPMAVRHPDHESGPNHGSLTEGRARYTATGSSSARALERGLVRAPLPHELE